jgi:hypothetical protein
LDQRHKGGTPNKNQKYCKNNRTEKMAIAQLRDTKDQGNFISTKSVGSIQLFNNTVPDIEVKNIK